jgi:hypothetical protein
MYDTQVIKAELKIFKLPTLLACILRCPLVAVDPSIKVTLFFLVVHLP